MHWEKKLPIGIQTFENLIEEVYYYVDKTGYISGLRNTGKYYFLSRPRRFGKSLLLSTIEAAFQGKRTLFSGLFLENNWDWETVHPVIHISFGAGVMRSTDDLCIRFTAILNHHARKFGVTFQYNDLRERFAELIVELHTKYNQEV
ncbi:MAG: AAA family ATPase [Thermodesulfobacteriota bacterium]|nr:AAA family ATPase [Thermodesulfobacteriota bacterium]